MRRSRSILVCAALVALAAGPVLAQSGSDVEQLKKKVEALEAKVAALEARLAAGGAAAAPAENPLEVEANAKYQEISRLVAAGDMMKAKDEMAEFMKKYGTTRAAGKARSTQQELAVIGLDAPADWGIEKWFQGEKDISLDAKGTTLVVFWELWCPHCKREVPKLESIYSTMKKDGLEVVGLTRITRSATEEGVSSFLKEQNVSYPVAKENGATATHFNVSGIPAAAVVKNGKVVWRGHPARLTESMLRAWL